MTEKISEDEMILEWLKGELHSVRFSDRLRERMHDLKLTESIISKANLQNPHENALRKELMEFRGYNSKTELFEGFPDIHDWQIIQMPKSDALNKVHYINYSYWNELTGNSRLPMRAAKIINEGLEIFGVSNAGFLNIANKIKQGFDFPPIIIVGDDHKMIVLEGHARLTGFALAEMHLPPTIPVIYGYHLQLSDWESY